MDQALFTAVVRAADPLGGLKRQRAATRAITDALQTHPDPRYRALVTKLLPAPLIGGQAPSQWQTVPSFVVGFVTAFLAATDCVGALSLLSDGWRRTIQQHGQCVIDKHANHWLSWHQRLRGHVLGIASLDAEDENDGALQSLGLLPRMTNLTSLTIRADEFDFRKHPRFRLDLPHLRFLNLSEDWCTSYPAWSPPDTEFEAKFEAHFPALESLDASIPPAVCTCDVEGCCNPAASVLLLAALQSQRLETVTTQDFPAGVGWDSWKSLVGPALRHSTAKSWTIVQQGERRAADWGLSVWAFAPTGLTHMSMYLSDPPPLSRSPVPSTSLILVPCARTLSSIRIVLHTRRRTYIRSLLPAGVAFPSVAAFTVTRGCSLEGVSPIYVDMEGLDSLLPGVANCTMTVSLAGMRAYHFLNVIRNWLARDKTFVLSWSAPRVYWQKSTNQLLQSLIRLLDALERRKHARLHDFPMKLPEMHFKKELGPRTETIFKRWERVCGRENTPSVYVQHKRVRWQ